LCVIDRFLKLVGVKPQQTTTGMSSAVFVPTTVFSATHLYILYINTTGLHHYSLCTT